MGLNGKEHTDYPFRVYALELAHDCVYIGIAHKADVKRAVNRHFADSSNVHFTTVHAPRRVLLVWPAISTAVEAYVYYAYLSTMTFGVGNGSQFRLGGWVQTSSKLSPVSAMVQEQARRQLRSQCFNCGSSDHYASKCKAPLHGCTYKCNAVGCGSSILVTSRGQTPQVPSASDAPAPVRKRLASEAPAEAPVTKRLTSEASSVRERTRARQGRMSVREGKQVLALNTAYTSLSWFLGISNPTPKQTRIARAQCSENALQLSGCHVRALDGHAAVPPCKPASLTGNRIRLGNSFVDTELPGIQIRRNAALTCRLSQVLFPVEDLCHAFGT